MEKAVSHDALFTDFYELTMAQGYFVAGVNDRAVFDMFFRRNPFGGGFSIFAGLGTLLDAIMDFTFSAEDVEYLRSLKIFRADFLDYLKGFRFTGDLYAMREGEVIFPQEPLVRVEAPLIECQILEGVILNTINFQSLIATKTARIHNVTDKPIMEFGLRRAQGSDGAMSATRAAMIGGAAGTSNTLAARLYGIRAMGTMAHSWVMGFPDELTAFRTYSALYPDNAIFLIDTYDTLHSGILNAIKAGSELVAKGHNFGVRLDSGDIGYLTREVRKRLDAAGFPSATISVSNELTEEIVSTLTADKAPVDSWGVGTHMVTGGTESSFTGVYKLCAKTVGDTLQSVMKFSDNPEKATNPGLKDVYRLSDSVGAPIADIIALHGEKLAAGEEYTFSHPMMDFREFTTIASNVEPLLHNYIKNGARVGEMLPQSAVIEAASRYREERLAAFDESYKRILNPHIYKVSLTQDLKRLKANFLKHNKHN